jgi:dTMP kinase
VLKIIVLRLNKGAIMKNKKGKFITFEGGEGVGKSTNIAFCYKFLQDNHKVVCITREPGGTEISEIIRESLLKKTHNETMMPMTELLLIFAARAQHVENVIRPALERGEWVLCDRFTDSTIAYQGLARGLGLAAIEQLKDMTQQGVEPDLTLLLDAPVDIGMGRVAYRGKADRFELENNVFFEKVRQSFLSLSQKYSDRIKVIDASQNLKDVQNDVERCLNLFVNQHKV